MIESLEVEGGHIANVTPDATGVRVFKGVPFAAPPVGPRRWRPPAAIEPWKGVRRADEFAAACAQPSLISDGMTAPEVTSEDCLYLNILTPAQSAAERLPVFVWIHGGAFLIGSSREIDARNLARRGIVVVTVAYRLGVFGFLSHPWLTAESAHAASGNYGLMDQIAALQWIQRNIASFGGDPSQVTIGGSSAGATSVNILMVSPLTGSLFHRAIGQSGAAMRATGLTDGSPLSRPDEERKGEEFARELAVGTLAELRRLPTAELVEAGGCRWETWTWNASIDGWVLPEAPEILFDRGAQHDVPLLAGWTSNEGASLARGAFGDDEVSFRQQIESRFGQAAAALLRLYPNGSTALDRSGKVKLAGDGFIAFPTWAWAAAQMRTGLEPVYLYVFDQPPPVPPDWPRRASMLGEEGAYHGSSQLYLFEAFARHRAWPFTDADRRLGARMAEYWAVFIRSGDPNGSDRPRWPSHSPTGKPQKMYFRDGQAIVMPDEDLARLSALAPLFAANPGALRYRGMGPRWLGEAL